MEEVAVLHDRLVQPREAKVSEVREVTALHEVLVDLVLNIPLEIITTRRDTMLRDPVQETRLHTTIAVERRPHPL